VVEDPRGNTLGRGSRVTLRLKEDAHDYLSEDKLKESAKKYSQFIQFPIHVKVTKEMEAEAEEDDDDDKDDEEVKKYDVETKDVKMHLNATWILALTMVYEVCAIIFSAKNIKISNDRLGLTRSASVLILFIVIHAVGNLQVFKGPDDSNGYGYFYIRLRWTGFDLPANIVEEYILCVLLHVFAGPKRMWDMKLALVGSQGISVLSLAISGLILLTFMTIHLFQFRFGDTDPFGPYYIKPPPYLINFWGISFLNLFWTNEDGIQPVGVRDTVTSTRWSSRSSRAPMVLLHLLRAHLHVPRLRGMEEGLAATSTPARQGDTRSGPRLAQTGL
jgi:hypothetical protein